MTSLTLIMSALGTKKTGLHQSVVMLTGTMTFLFIRSFTTESVGQLFLCAAFLKPSNASNFFSQILSLPAEASSGKTPG